MFWEVYMRFGSTKELLSHFHATTEEEALRRLCAERGLNEREVLRRARVSRATTGDEPHRVSSFLNFVSPYGYDHVEGSLRVNTKEARIVSLIFRRYLEGKGIAKICRELNRDGCRTKTGRSWASQTIANILSNPVYCGLTRSNGRVRRGRHEMLIQAETFNRVQQEMERRIRRPDQKRTDRLQLSLEDY